MNTETSKIYSEFVSSVKEQLLNDFPMISCVEHKRLFGYWIAEDTNLMQLEKYSTNCKLRNSIFMLLILESEEIGEI